MTLASQVVSLELAKKLKELGVKQESVFCWTKWRHSQEQGIEWRWRIKLCEALVFIQNTPEEFYAAFTVAELGEMLPPGTISHKNIDDTHEEWVCQINSEDTLIVGRTEADARAKMLIHLIEQKLVTP